MKNRFKTLACALFLAAIPMTAMSAAADDVSAPEVTAVAVADDQSTTTTTTTTVTTTSGTEQSTTATGDESTTTTDVTTTDEVVSTSFDPNRIAIQDVEVNATEADVAAGKKYKIDLKKIPLNATDDIVIRYISSDETIATVDNNGVVTAIKPGKVTITVIADSVIPMIQDQALETYTVLILDNSGSMWGEPIIAQRDAAKKFCADTLADTTDSSHKFAVITLDSSTVVKTDFTNDLATLNAAIESTSANGSTNYTDALKTAAQLLSKVSTNALKNIVICSDGLPYGGDTSTTGPYTYSEYYDYEYANAAYTLAQELKKDYDIYTLGFFHGLSGDDLEFGRKYMKDVASFDSSYAEVTDVNDLESVFAEVAGNAVKYKKVGSVTKLVDVNVTEGDPAQAKKETAKTSDQDSPKTGDNNHNAMLITFIFVALAGAVVSAKARRTDK